MLTLRDIHRPIVGAYVEIYLILPLLSRVDLTNVIISNDGSADFGNFDFGKVMPRASAIALTPRDEAGLFLCYVVCEPSFWAEVV